jgi:hypothetical protein
MSLFQGRGLEERLDRRLPADGRARLECEFFIEDLLTKKELGGAAKRSGDRIDVFAAIREFRDFIQSSCLARVMALNNKPIQRSPGEQQERFPYIDRAIRLFLIVEGRGKGANT